MKTIIKVLGRFIVIAFFALLVESLLTAGMIYDITLWEYWLTWVIQIAYLILQIWATLEWCEEDRIL